MEMTKERALELVKQHVKKKNLIKHMLATGACMRALAERFNGDPDRWEIAGILHDLDYDETYDDYPRHAIRTVEILRELGYDDEKVLNAILAHADKKEIENEFEQALYAVDPTTGFIVAAALMHPTKKLANIDLGFLKRRFKEKRFAAGANRDQMRSIEKIGLSLDEFLEICLKAMQSISEELGL